MVKLRLARLVVATLLEALAAGSTSSAQQNFERYMARALSPLWETPEIVLDSYVGWRRQKHQVPAKPKNNVPKGLRDTEFLPEILHGFKKRQNATWRNWLARGVNAERLFYSLEYSLKGSDNKLMRSYETRR